MHIRVDVHFALRYERQGFLRVAVECACVLVQGVVPPTVVYVGVSGDGFAAAQHVEVALPFAHKLLAPFKVYAVERDVAGRHRLGGVSRAVGYYGVEHLCGSVRVVQFVCGFGGREVDF